MTVSFETTTSIAAPPDVVFDLSIGRMVEKVVLCDYLERLIVERGEFLKTAAERQHMPPRD